jgi:hypothetical protein
MVSQEILTKNFVSQEILTKNPVFAGLFCQETLIKTLLPCKQPRVK